MCIDDHATTRTAPPHTAEVLRLLLLVEDLEVELLAILTLESEVRRHTALLLDGVDLRLSQSHERIAAFLMARGQRAVLRALHDGQGRNDDAATVRQIEPALLDDLERAIDRLGRSAAVCTATIERLRDGACSRDVVLHMALDRSAQLTARLHPRLLCEQMGLTVNGSTPSPPAR